MAVCRDAGRIDMDYAEMASLGTRALASPVQAVAQAGQVLADAAGKTGDSTDTQARLDTERAAIALSKACDEAGYGG